MDAVTAIADEKKEGKEKKSSQKTCWTFRASLLAACLNGVAVGNLAGWPQAAAEKLLQDSSYDLKPFDIPWIFGIFYFGMLAGGFTSLVLAGWFGKRWLFLVACVPIFSGWLIIHLAEGFWVFLIARIILGLGGGMMFHQTEMYLSEITRMHWRPRMSVVFCASIHFGVLVSFVVGPLRDLNEAPPIFYMPVVVVQALLFLFVAPETPYWLVRKDRVDEGLESLRKLRGRADVHEEFQEIVDFVEQSKCISDHKQTSFWHGIRKILSERANRRGLILVIFMTTAQQFSGMAAMNSYASLIFGNTMSSLTTYHVVTLIGTIELGCTLCSGYLVVHTKRRVLTTWSTILCSGCMILMGHYFHKISQDTETLEITKIPIQSGGLSACVVVMALAYGLGLATLPTVVASECLSIDARNLGAAVQNTTLCFSMFLISHLWILITETLGLQYAFFISGIVTALHCILLLIILPETSQKSLIEIQGLFNKTRPSLLESFRNSFRMQKSDSDNDRTKSGV